MTRVKFLPSAHFFGEVLRGIGDDQGSLEHYHAALQIEPSYISSQYELGNTRTLMGDFAGARQEYDRAMPLAQNPMDELYVKYLKSLVCFWEGEPAEGRKELAALVKEAEGKKEPNSQFQIGFARAMLAVDPQSELEQPRRFSGSRSSHRRAEDAGHGLPRSAGPKLLRIRLRLHPVCPRRRCKCRRRTGCGLSFGPGPATIGGSRRKVGQCSSGRSRPHGSQISPQLRTRVVPGDSQPCGYAKLAAKIRL